MEPSELNEGSSKPEEDLAFDYQAIRLVIGLIALLFPLVVWISASRITDSISWSYHTNARDFFVGFLFVISAFLLSYKGHKKILKKNEIGKFWNWVNKYWKKAIDFRIWEREHEEDWVSTVGGIAAFVVAIFPTALCIEKTCSPEPTSTIHYIGAVILFSTTVYFCLVAFISAASKKLDDANKELDDASKKLGDANKELDDASKKLGDTSATLEDNQELPEKSNDLKGLTNKICILKRRINIYSICGWGIVLVMLGLFAAIYTEFNSITNIKFWAETAALILFGFAWLIASKYLPYFTDEADRQITRLELWWRPVAKER